MRFRLMLIAMAAIAAVVPALADNLPGKPRIIPQSWQSGHNLHNPLVGKLYSMQGEQKNPAELIDRFENAQYLLLGEQHDNPDHHLIQSLLLASFNAQKERPVAVVFEMVPQRLQHVLDEVARHNPPDYLNRDKRLETLSKNLEWEKRGWYSWNIYQPLFLAAIAERMPMKAGNLNRATIKAISRNGFDALESAQQARLGLQQSFPHASQVSLHEELEKSHCGLLPAAALPAMAKVQRAKDGSMANALIKAGARRPGAVLIAGNGHVRNDRGVPYVLRKLDPKAEVLSIGIIETVPGADTFSDYDLKNEQGAPLYDYVIFTPKFDTVDHCAALREQLGKKSPDGKKEQN